MKPIKDFSLLRLAMQLRDRGLALIIGGCGSTAAGAGIYYANVVSENPSIGKAAVASLATAIGLVSAYVGLEGLKRANYVKEFSELYHEADDVMREKPKLERNI